MKSNARKSFRKLLAKGKVGVVHFGRYKCSLSVYPKQKRKNK